MKQINMQDQKQSEFDPVEAANKIIALSKQSWEERFDEEFVRYNGKDVEPSFNDPNGDVQSVKNFIYEEIQKATMEADKKAREEEREEIINVLLEQKYYPSVFPLDEEEGAFNKSIDKLINKINK